MKEDTKKKISESLKGNIPWNKGKKGVQIPWNKGLKLGPNPGHSKKMKGRKLTEEHRKKIGNALRGREKTREFKEKMRKVALKRVENGTHNFYKGDNIGYMAIHSWLYREFGKARRCENSGCKYENPKMYVWALVKGKKYERKRENFMQLCQSCHMKYDIFNGNITR